MLAKRIIPCMDIANGRIVKGVRFLNLRDAGDPVEQARAYDEAGADELAFLDISATAEGRATVVDLVRRVAEQVFLPLTVGGGIRIRRGYAPHAPGGGRQGLCKFGCRAHPDPPQRGG